PPADDFSGCSKASWVVGGEDSKPMSPLYRTALGTRQPGCCSSKVVAVLELRHSHGRSVPWFREGAMNNPLPGFPPVGTEIDYEKFVTEDENPVDMFTGSQQRLLVQSLHSGWERSNRGLPFLATQNVGLFYSISEPAIVPDVMLS